MSASDLVARLAQAGLDPQLLADVAKELFEGEIERRILADRRKHERERKAKSRSVTGQDVTSQEVTGQKVPSEASPQTPLPNSLQNTHPLPLKGVSPTKKPTRLPSDWQPQPLAGKAAQMVEAWQPGALERELAKFKNYWLARGGNNATRTDWQRTWVNWLISADERIPRDERPNKSPIAEAYNRVFGAG